MALGTPCYQCRRNRNLPLGGGNCRGDPEFQDREAGLVGHWGSIGCGGRPWRRLREISRREKCLKYACVACGSFLNLFPSIHRKGPAPSQGESLRLQPGGNEALLLRCAQHRTEPPRGHAPLVRASRKDRMLSGKTNVEDCDRTWVHGHTFTEKNVIFFP